jgi:rRNA biogenesis protein RRP5
MHGTPQSLEKLFKEAVQYNDAKTVHLRMASILERTDKPEVSRPA